MKLKQALVDRNISIYHLHKQIEEHISYPGLLNIVNEKVNTSVKTARVITKAINLITPTRPVYLDQLF